MNVAAWCAEGKRGGGASRSCGTPARIAAPRLGDVAQPDAAKDRAGDPVFELLAVRRRAQVVDRREVDDQRVSIAGRGADAQRRANRRAVDRHARLEVGTRAAGDEAQQVVRNRHAGVDAGGADVPVIPRNGHGHAGVAGFGNGSFRGQVGGEVSETAVAVHGQTDRSLTGDAGIGGRVEPAAAKLVGIVGDHARAVGMHAAQIVGGEHLGQLVGLGIGQTQSQGGVAGEALQTVGRDRDEVRWRQVELVDGRCGGHGSALSVVRAVVTSFLGVSLLARGATRQRQQHGHPK